MKNDIDMYVPSDKYFNNPEKFSDMEDMGIDCNPVDIFGAYVPKSKNDADNFEEAQESIRKRFSLGG